MEAVRHLYEAIQERVNSWRRDRYPCAEYPAIGEILEYARLPEPDSLRFLRRPQLRALETYWYLRLIERTAKIPDLYRNYFTKPKDRLDALGIPSAHERVTEILAEGGGVDAFLRRVADDDSLVKDLKLESLRETLTLDYPSYIFALAMGAGKTILIGTIIATEFAMALEYPDGPFVQNALVFAPGKTILEALKELGDVPFDKVLPPRLYKDFAASLKLTFTRDGEKDLPVVRGSAFNVVVTNTEKIRIQKPTMRRVQGWTQIELQERERQEQEIANLRLQAIASLPNLAIFSDEAHHTYGPATVAALRGHRAGTPGGCQRARGFGKSDASREHHTGRVRPVADRIGRGGPRGSAGGGAQCRGDSAYARFADTAGYSRHGPGRTRDRGRRAASTTGRPASGGSPLPRGPGECWSAADTAAGGCDNVGKPPTPPVG